MKLALIVALASFHQISAEAEADPQFFALPPGNTARVNQGCPNTAPLPRSTCAGKTSTCWSPGVRDTDCPGHGLCCFDGCVNVCIGAVAPVLPVAPVVPVVPVR